MRRCLRYPAASFIRASDDGDGGLLDRFGISLPAKVLLKEQTDSKDDFGKREWHPVETKIYQALERKLTDEQK